MKLLRKLANAIHLGLYRLTFICIGGTGKWLESRASGAPL
jgi:hypothetical protein